MLLISVLILLVVHLMNRRYLGDSYSILNPVSLSIYVWSMVLIVHNCFFEHYVYTDSVYFIICVGNISLYYGFRITAKKRVILGKKADRTVFTYNCDGIKKILGCFTLIEVLRIIYNIYIIVYKLAGSWNAFFYNGTYVRRLYLSYSGGAMASIFEFFCNATALSAYVFVGILFAQNKKKYYKQLFVWSFMEVLYALITMSKMCLVIYIIVVVTAYFNNLDSHREQMKYARKYAPVLIIFMFTFLLSIGIQRNYAQSGNSLIETVIRKAGIYFSGPTEALGRYISTDGSDWTMGSKTFVVFARICSRLGLSSNSAVLAHGEDINIGYDSINAYTWFKVFYQDFSYIGVLAIPFLVGLIAGTFYNQKNHNYFTDTCSAWIAMSVVMSFYTFMWGQTIYLFILVYAYFIHSRCRRMIYNLA